MGWTGQALQKARKRRGWTQAALARKLGVHRVTVAKLETDTQRPSLDLLERIAKALSVEVGALLRRSP